MRTSSFAVVLRWVARIWSIFSIFTILTLLSFTVGGATGGRGPRPTLQEWIGLALLPAGAGLGLVVAWYREKLGGILALGCLIFFYGWNLLRSGHLPEGPFFFVMAVPSLLFLLAGLLCHRGSPREP
jgi:hypothetical protein